MNEEQPIHPHVGIPCIYCGATITKKSTNPCPGQKDIAQDVTEEKSANFALKVVWLGALNNREVTPSEDRRVTR